MNPIQWQVHSKMLSQVASIILSKINLGFFKDPSPPALHVQQFQKHSHSSLQASSKAIPNSIRFKISAKDLLTAPKIRQVPLLIKIQVPSCKFYNKIPCLRPRCLVGKKFTEHLKRTAKKPKRNMRMNSERIIPQFLTDFL